MTKKNSPGPAGSSKRNDIPPAGDGLSREEVSRPAGAEGKHEPIEWRGILFTVDFDEHPLTIYTEPSGKLTLERHQCGDQVLWGADFGVVTVTGDTPIKALESARSQVESVARAVGLIPEVKP